ncbi:hypothetical protein KUTeg_007342 [Tegillarca granosa]|uniref:Endonuclease/exonuclease/phosphatase domain-containing protein n=1 Tax=Tegillarca granosa TaxID=220873 RepID=A0ABQ9FH45_TEGGR|nr:hypothetical protein KUTeg_007342 [Tegillarca granosa]
MLDKQKSSMPRGNKKSPAAAAPKRASRSSTRSADPVPEPESEPTSTRATRGSRSGDDSTPKKVARKASPSPAPASRKESRGRTPRGKQAKAKEVEEETKPEPAKQTAKGRGDAPESRSGSRGRVTRAVVQEEVQSPRSARGRSSRTSAAPEVEEENVVESPKPRSRSAAKSKTATPKKETVTPKRSPRKKAASTSRSRSRGAKKSTVVEAEDDDNEEEEEEEDQGEPTPEIKQPKGKKKTPAKEKVSPARKSPVQKKGGRRSAESGEIQEAQIVLTKIDDEEPHRVEEPQTTTSRRSRSRGKKPEDSVETSPSTRPSPRSRTPRAAAEKATPKRQSRSRGSKIEQMPEQDKVEESSQDEGNKEEEMPALDSKLEDSSQKEEKMDEDMPDLNKQNEGKQETEDVVQKAEKTEEEPSQVEKEKATQEEKPVEPAQEAKEAEEEEEEQQEPSAIEDISSEETAEDKQDEIELLETEDAVDAGQPTKENQISAADSNVANDVGMAPVVDVAQNGADQGLVSPSRKRKLDDSVIDDDDSMPKKARRSIDVEEVQENGEEAVIQQGQPEVMETEVQAQPVITPGVVEPVSQPVPIVNSSQPEPTVVNDLTQVVPHVTETVLVMNETGAEEMETEPAEPVAEQVPIAPVAVAEPVGVPEPVSEAQPPVEESSEQDVSKEYVVIDMQDVPSSDSSEVLSSLPKMPVLNVQEEVMSAPVESVQDQLQVQDVGVNNVPVDSVQIQSEEPVVQTINNSVESVSVDNQKTFAPTMPEQIVSDNVTNLENNPILSREFIPNPEFEGKELDLTKQFSVISYNILAQCHLERNNDGYSYTEREFLELKNRHDRLMEELKSLDGDVVCLQEVEPEYYSNYLQPSFKSLGYDSLFMKRTDDYFAEGEATFFKTSRFTLVSSSSHSLAELAEKDLAETGLDDSVKASVRKYLNRPDVLVITKLQCNNTGNIVTIASAIKEVVKTAGSDMSPHILCGDFNSKEASPAYQLTTEGYLGDEMLQTLQNLTNVEMEDGSKAALVNHLWGAFQHTSTNLKSAYFVTMGCEPDITSYNEVMCATVDYQFYSMGCLDNVGVLETAAEDEVMKTGGIPNKIFPSDHISLKATYSFK